MELDNTKLRQVQLLQLELIKKVHAVCVENGYRYTMLSGTLLGAVRHRGFIPWDDDLDIGLPRPDYEKLVKNLRENPIEGCFFQDFITEEHYTLPFAKLRLNNTLYLEDYWKEVDMHHGVFIDIFPLDKIKKPGSKATELRRLIAKQITFSIWRKEGCRVKRSGVKRVESVLSALISTLPKKSLINIQNNIVKRENKNWKYLTSMFTSNYNTKRVFFNLESFDHLTLLDYEDTQLYATSDYKTVLGHLYTNYMELPPVEKRKSGHNIVDVSVQ